MDINLPLADEKKESIFAAKSRTAELWARFVDPLRYGISLVSGEEHDGDFSLAFLLFFASSEGQDTRRIIRLTGLWDVQKSSVSGDWM